MLKDTREFLMNKMSKIVNDPLVTDMRDDIAAVPFGKELEQPEVKAFFEDEKNVLPVVLFTDENGEAKCIDMAKESSMLISASPRSGKSWLLTSIIMQMASFNSPRDVNFVIVDPKDCSLFKNVGKLPHVLNVCNADNVLDTFDKLWETVERRKKILEALGYLNIHDLNKHTAERMSHIFIIIDEGLTLRDKLKADGRDKKFNEYLKKFMCQTPYLGIHVILCAHRPKGMIDATLMSMINTRIAMRYSNFTDMAEEALNVRRDKITKEVDKPGMMTVAMNFDNSLHEAVWAVPIAHSDLSMTHVINEVAKEWSKLLYNPKVELTEEDKEDIRKNMSADEAANDKDGFDNIF